MFNKKYKTHIIMKDLNKLELTEVKQPKLIKRRWGDYLTVILNTKEQLLAC